MKGRTSLNTEKRTIIDKLGSIINLAGTAVMMNLLFLVSCLGVVTVGQAWCGLLSAIRYNIRGESWFAGFKKGFKTRFWRGTILWTVGGLLCFVFLRDINNALYFNSTGVLPFSCFMLAFVGALIQSGLLLNVYIYTDVNNWLKNTVNLLFKGLIPMVLVAGFFWLPVILLLIVDAFIVYEIIMILIFAYFVVIALVCTMVMKPRLTQILIDCRADGLIVAEEGVTDVKKEEEEVEQ